MSAQKEMLTAFIHTRKNIKSLKSKSNHTNSVSIPVLYPSKALPTWKSEQGVEMSLQGCWYCNCTQDKEVVFPQTVIWDCEKTWTWTGEACCFLSSSQRTFSEVPRGLQSWFYQSTDYGWERVNVLHSSLYRTMFVSKTMLTTQGHFIY